MGLINEILSKIENEKIGSREHIYYVGMLQGALKMVDKEVVSTTTTCEVTPQTEVKKEEKTTSSNLPVVAYKCEECGSIVVLKHDVEQPHLCKKCNNYHHFGDMLKASYHCQCGAKWHLSIEEDVDKLKCRYCGHEHQLTYDYAANEFRSTEDIRKNN